MTSQKEKRGVEWVHRFLKLDIVAKVLFAYETDQLDENFKSALL